MLYLARDGLNDEHTRLTPAGDNRNLLITLRTRAAGGPAMSKDGPAFYFPVKVAHPPLTFSGTHL